MTEEIKAPDKIKVGFYQEEGGAFTAFVQIRELPDEEAAKRASTWLADLLLSCAKPPDVKTS